MTEWTLIEALEWALRRIRTSLDQGDYYEKAEAALAAAQSAPSTETPAPAAWRVQGPTGGYSVQLIEPHLTEPGWSKEPLYLAPAAPAVRDAHGNFLGHAPAAEQNAAGQAHRPLSAAEDEAGLGPVPAAPDTEKLIERVQEAIYALQCAEKGDASDCSASIVDLRDVLAVLAAPAEAAPAAIAAPQEANDGRASAITSEAPAAAAQEPVAIVTAEPGALPFRKVALLGTDVPVGTPLYAAPQAVSLGQRSGAQPAGDDSRSVSGPGGPAASAPTAQAHTDHPLRHWDRTCPACIAEDAAEAGKEPSRVDAIMARHGWPAPGGLVGELEMLARELEGRRLYVSQRPADAKAIEQLHALVDQLAGRFKGYLPWPDDLRTSTVRSHEMFIEDTIKRADVIAGLVAPAARDIQNGSPE